MGGWLFDARGIAEGRGIHCSLLAGDDPVSCREVGRLWREDAAFRDVFRGVLAGVDYAAFLWETPPVTQATFGRPFEFVVWDSPALARFTPEPDVFAEHFGEGGEIVDFPNLGRDAHLVVPSPVGRASASTHLASFARNGEPDQWHRLWTRVGRLWSARVRGAPTWLSTCGLGVGWLHVRLDSSPKYYRHGAYRREP